jgi:hypothetical protein
MDVTSKYLNDCSPYIGELIYDVGNRSVYITLLDNPNKCIPVVKLEFKNVESYSEETIDSEYDDECLDSVIGLNWLRHKELCIHTEKKELIIKFDGNIVSSKIG